MKVYVIDLPVHIPAENAEEAQRWWEHHFGGDGPATISVDGANPVRVFYVNCEAREVNESDHSYDSEDSSLDPAWVESFRLPHDEPITRTHVHAGNPEHRGTYQGVVNGMHAWRCSCGDTVFTVVVPPPRPDVFGRDWGPTNDEELCATCGQPDNCGDCDHGPMTDDDYRTLTRFDEPEGWDGSRPLQ